MDELNKENKEELKEQDTTGSQRDKVILHLRIVESKEQENGSIMVTYVGVDLNPKEHLYLLAKQTQSKDGFFKSLVD